MPTSPALGRFRDRVAAAFLSPAPLSAGVCRVALATFFILTLTWFLPAGVGWLDAHPPAAYQPVGILRVYGSDGPPVGVLAVASAVARVGGWLLLVGLYTRLSLLAVTVAMWYLVAANYSFGGTLVQTYVPAQLAAVGLLAGVRSPLSADYLLDRWRGRAGAAYWATPRAGVLMCLFAVGWPFFNAALYKLYLGNHHFGAWIYSDNLRNTVLFQWHKFQEPLPAHVKWLVERPWACRVAAGANVFIQAAAILACVFVRRQWLRAGLGVLLLVEVLGLGLVMNMWASYGTLWLPLALFFPDWDVILGRWLRPPAGVPAAAPGGRWQIGLCLAFMAAVVGISLSPDIRRSTYPVIPFSMFSGVMADPPYDTHKPFAVPVTNLEVESTPPLTPAQRRELFFEFDQPRGQVDVELGRVLAVCQQQFHVRVHAVWAFRGTDLIPAAPDTQIRPHVRATWFRWTEADGDGRMHALTLKGVERARPRRGQPYRVQLVGHGFTPTEVSFGAYFGPDPQMVVVPAQRLVDGGYELSIPDRPELMLLVVQARAEPGGERETYFGNLVWPAR
jgi:hypothetical protein